MSPRSPVLPLAAGLALVSAFDPVGATAPSPEVAAPARRVPSMVCVLLDPIPVGLGQRWRGALGGTTP